MNSLDQSFIKAYSSPAETGNSTSDAASQDERRGDSTRLPVPHSSGATLESQRMITLRLDIPSQLMQLNEMHFKPTATASTAAPETSQPSTPPATADTEAAAPKTEKPVTPPAAKKLRIDAAHQPVPKPHWQRAARTRIEIDDAPVGPATIESDAPMEPLPESAPEAPLPEPMPEPVPTENNTPIRQVPITPPIIVQSTLDAPVVQLLSADLESLMAAPAAASEPVETRGAEPETEPEAAEPETAPEPIEAEQAAIVEEPPVEPTTESEPQQEPLPEPEPEEDSTEEVPQWTKPAYEVDHYRWPDVCTSIVERVGNELSHMAERLLDVAQGGKNVVMIGGTRRGEGRTTFLLCLARQLSAMNAHCLLIDADFEQPMLAQNLGIAPQLGWEDVTGRKMPTSEVMIEAVDDQLALLPVRAAVHYRPVHSGEVDWQTTIETVREHYQLVLIDTSPISHADVGDILSLESRGGIDWAILLQDQHRAADTGLAADRLRAAGIETLGIVQNFQSGRRSGRRLNDDVIPTPVP